MLSSQPTMVQQQYTSVLMGSSNMGPAAVAAIRSVYAAACPHVLEAATVHLPSAAEMVAARAEDADPMSVGPVGGGHLDSGSGIVLSSLWRQYCTLLDVAVLVMTDTASALAPLVSASKSTDMERVGRLAGLLAVAVQSLQRLLAADNFATGLVAPEVVGGLVGLLTSISHNVLAPMLWAVARGRDGRCCAWHVGLAMW